MAASAGSARSATMTDTELSPDERDALARLRRDVLPPAGADARTIAGAAIGRSAPLPAPEPVSVDGCGRCSRVRVCRGCQRGTGASRGRQRSVNRASSCCSTAETRMIAPTGERNTPAGRIPSRHEASTSRVRSCRTRETRFPPERPMGRRLAATSSWRPRARPRPGRSRRRALTCATVGEL